MGMNAAEHRSADIARDRPGVCLGQARFPISGARSWCGARCGAAGGVDRIARRAVGAAGSPTRSTGGWRCGTSSDGYAAWVASAERPAGACNIGAPVHGGWPLAATLAVPGLSLTGGDSDDVPGGLAWSADRLVLRVDSACAERAGDCGRGHGNGFASPGTVPRCLTLPTASASNCRCSQETGRDFAALACQQSARRHCIRQATPASDHCSCVWRSAPAAQSGEPALTFPSKPRRSASRLASRGRSARASRAWRWRARWTGPCRSGAPRRSGGGLARRRRLAGDPRFAVELGATGPHGQRNAGARRPIAADGSRQAALVGYAETLDALAAHGAISRSAATAAKAVLSLLAQRPDDGSPPEVEVPLTLAVSHAVDAAGAAGAAAGTGLA